MQTSKVAFSMYFRHFRLTDLLLFVSWMYRINRTLLWAYILLKNDLTLSHQNYNTTNKKTNVQVTNKKPTKTQDAWKCIMFYKGRTGLQINGKSLNASLSGQKRKHFHSVSHACIKYVSHQYTGVHQHRIMRTPFLNLRFLQKIPSK